MKQSFCAICRIMIANVAGIFLTFAPHVVLAESDNVVQTPLFINPNTPEASVGPSTIRTIRFLTTDDFPPFNFLDPKRQLTGFNVALAREICLEITARCTMQAVPWESLDAALDRGQGDALIAGIAITPDSLERYIFTQPYMRLPGRFFAVKSVAAELTDFENPGTLPLGVVAGTAHAAFVARHFPNASVTRFEDDNALRAALTNETVKLAFSDAVSTSFWMHSASARDCCRFVGGAYINPEFFGDGFAIAVMPNREDLKQTLDDVLKRLSRNGKFSEIYLRYFPISIY